MLENIIHLNENVQTQVNQLSQYAGLGMRNMKRRKYFAKGKKLNCLLLQFCSRFSPLSDILAKAGHLVIVSIQCLVQLQGGNKTKGNKYMQKAVINCFLIAAYSPGLPLVIHLKIP